MQSQKNTHLATNLFCKTTHLLHWEKSHDFSKEKRNSVLHPNRNSAARKILFNLRTCLLNITSTIKRNPIKKLFIWIKQAHFWQHLLAYIFFSAFTHVSTTINNINNQFRLPAEAASIFIIGIFPMVAPSPYIPNPKILPLLRSLWREERW